MSGLELVGAGAGFASGWIAAFVVMVLLYRQRGELADKREETAHLEHNLEAAQTRLETEKTQHEHWRTEHAIVSGQLADCRAKRVDDADSDELADMASRGVHEDEDGDGEGPVRGSLR